MFNFKKKNEDVRIAAIAKAKMIPLEEVKDEVFSSKALGEGVAFELKEDVICAPVNGELTALFPTGHAFGIRCQDGVEILVHIGIDTVELDGVGFTTLVKQGSKVKSGQVIVKLDREIIRNKGYDLTTMLLITNTNGKHIAFSGYGEVERGQYISKG